MTTAPNIERVVYDEWQTGFRSRLRIMGRNTKEYTAFNMQVYDNGALGIRPMWKLQNTTGLVSTDTLDNNAFCAWRPSAANSAGELWVHGYSGDVWVYDLDAGTWSAGPTGIDTHVTTSDTKGTEWGTTHDWSSNGDLVGSAQHAVLPVDNWIFGGEATINSADTVTGITWTDATDQVTNFTLYRDRVWGWHGPEASTDPHNRIYYTNAGSYTTAAAGNYIDLGAPSDGYYILGVWPLRDALLIAMNNGDWYAFTGTPDAGALRFVGNYVTPSHGAAGALLNNAVYFIAPFGRQVCIATPAGVDTTSLSHIRPDIDLVNWTTFHDLRALSSQQEQSLYLPVLRTTGDVMHAALEFVNGSWAYTRAVSDNTSEVGVGGPTLRDLAVIAGGRAYAFVTEDPNDTGGHELQLYTRDIVLNRPSRSTDTYSTDEEDLINNGGASELQDQTAGGVYLAQFGPPGMEVRIRQVIVDAPYWKDAAGTYPDPTIGCRAWDGRDDILESSTAANGYTLPDFTEAGQTASDRLGLFNRFVFPFDMDWFEPSIQVWLYNIRSIAIHRVIVDYEVRPDNHWAGRPGGT